jgi:hypothetical protein
VTPSLSAACEKLFRSTTAQNAASCRVSIRQAYAKSHASGTITLLIRANFLDKILRGWWVGVPQEEKFVRAR